MPPKRQRRARDYGYEIGIARLVSYIQPGNAASIPVAEKLTGKAQTANS